jgi:hypothetical protein
MGCNEMKINIQSYSKGCYQVELIDVDAFVSGECCVPGSGLESQPALVLELLLPHVLAKLDCALCQMKKQTIFESIDFTFTLNHEKSTFEFVIDTVCAEIIQRIHYFVDRS